MEETAPASCARSVLVYCISAPDFVHSTSWKTEGTMVSTALQVRCCGLCQGQKPWVGAVFVGFCVVFMCFHLCLLYSIGVH